jgi:hypothetical protein
MALNGSNMGCTSLSGITELSFLKILLSLQLQARHDVKLPMTTGIDHELLSVLAITN